MATTTPNYSLRKPAATDNVNVALDISANMDALDAHTHSGTYVALVAAPTGVAATDTAAIHAARDSVGANGRLVFPAGTYVVTGLTASVAGQTWDLSARTTIQLAASAGVDVITLAADNFTLRGGTIDGNRSAQAAAGGGVVVPPATTTNAGLSVEDVRFTNLYGYGVQAGAATVASDWRIHRCRFDTIRKSGFACSGGMSRLTVTENVMDLTGQDPAFHGVQVYGATVINFDIVVSDNVIRNTSGGATGGGPIEVQAAESCVIADNVVDGGRLGLTVGSASYLTVTGNSVRNQYSYGIELGGGNYQSVTGNIIDSCGIGIILDGAATDVTVAANTITRCNAASNGDGIRLAAAATRMSIVGNTITDNVNGSLITVASSSIDVLVADNVLTQTTAGNVTSVIALRVTGASRVAVLHNKLSIATTVVGINYAGAIHVDGLSDDVRIIGNTVIGTAVSLPLVHNGIQIATTSITKCEVRNNSVFGFAIGITNNGPSTTGTITDRILGNVVESCTTSYSIIASAQKTRTKREFEGTAAPGAGTWVVGDIFWNSNPTAAGQAIGWVCTAAGTPGTWRTLGATDSPVLTVTTKGDTLAATGAGVLARVAVGGNGALIVADSAASPGVSWQTPQFANSVRFPGTSNNYIAMADNATISIVGDIALIGYYILDDWTPAANHGLVAKYGSGSSRSYGMFIDTAGKVNLRWTPDGTSGSALSKVSTAATPFIDGQPGWVAASLDVDNGASGNDVKFWTSVDGKTWTQLGTTVTTAGVTSIFDGTDDLRLGEMAGTWQVTGNILHAEVRSGLGTTGLNGTVAAFFNGRVIRTNTRFPASVTQGGQTWSLPGSGWDWTSVDA